MLFLLTHIQMDRNDRSRRSGEAGRSGEAVLQNDDGSAAVQLDSQRERRKRHADMTDALEEEPDFTAPMSVTVVPAKPLPTRGVKEWQFADTSSSERTPPQHAWTVNFGMFSNKAKIYVLLGASSINITRAKSILVHFPLNETSWAVKEFSNTRGFTMRSLLEAFYKTGYSAVSTLVDTDAPAAIRRRLHKMELSGFRIAGKHVYIVAA